MVASCLRSPLHSPIYWMPWTTPCSVAFYLTATPNWSTYPGLTNQPHWFQITIIMWRWMISTCSSMGLVIMEATVALPRSCPSSALRHRLHSWRRTGSSVTVRLRRQMLTQRHISRRGSSVTAASPTPQAKWPTSRSITWSIATHSWISSCC